MKALQILIGGKSGRSDMTFGGVAVMAQQPTRLASVMAVVGARMSVALHVPIAFQGSEFSRANSATVALDSNKSVSDFIANTSAVSTHIGFVFRMFLRIGKDSLPVFFTVCGALFGITLLAAGLNLWAHIVSFSLGSSYLGFVVSLVTLNALLAMFLVGRTTVSQNRLPLFRRAFVFAFSHVTLPASVSLTTGEKEQIQ
jgi:hypothetical protein